MIKIDRNIYLNDDYGQLKKAGYNQFEYFKAYWHGLLVDHYPTPHPIHSWWKDFDGIRDKWRW